MPSPRACVRPARLVDLPRIARGARRAAVLSVALAALAWPDEARARERFKVMVPDTDNLQYLAFWVAKAGGSFDREGLDVEPVVAPSGPRSGTPMDAALDKGEVDGALAAPSIYLRMIARNAPIVLVANLFQNDPYALVVPREVAEARKVPTEGAVRDRLAALRGATIAFPPAAFGRLNALLVSQGVDIDKDVKTRMLLARDQAAPFKDKGIDAAYLASPHLERVVAGAGAVVVVNQARGEVPELTNRQTHLLVVTRQFATEHRDAVVAAVRAIAEAEKLIHASPSDAVTALAREQGARDRRELEAAVRLYEPAVPKTPEVRAEAIPPALALIPEGVPSPELTGVDLGAFIAPDITRAALGGASRGSRARWLGVVAAALIVTLVMLARRRRPARERPAP